MAKISKKALNSSEKTELIATLKARFEKNKHRHQGLDWATIQKKLDGNPDKLWSISGMEQSGGEPDVVGVDKKNNEFLFMDCSAESPAGRRSCCYDQEALEKRKEHKPASSAVKMALEMGIRLLTEEEYRYLQTLGTFDLKTSSWIDTPAAIRKLGGALFCDRRYNQVFTYHNGAESYYAARGFRGTLKL